MPSIEQSHAVERDIIAPMRQRWAQPKVSDSQDISTLLSDYIDDLHQYSRPVLQAAFIRVRQTHEMSTWPRSASFVKACREIEARESTATAQAGEGNYPWEEKVREARRLQSEYLNAAIRSRAVTDAVCEGWVNHLWRYLIDAAWVQAQHLAGVKSAGFNHNTLGDRPEKTVMGKITISVPVEKIQEWKRGAQNRSQQAAA